MRSALSSAAVVTERGHRRLTTTSLSIADISTTSADLGDAERRRHNRLWPRSVTTDAEPTDADRKAALLDMHRIRRDPRFGFASVVKDE